MFAGVVAQIMKAGRHTQGAVEVPVQAVQVCGTVPQALFCEERVLVFGEVFKAVYFSCVVLTSAVTQATVAVIVLLWAMGILRRGLVPLSVMLLESYRWSSVMPWHRKAQGMARGYTAAAGKQAELC